MRTNRLFFFLSSLVLAFTSISASAQTDPIKMPSLETRDGKIVGFTQQGAMAHCIEKGKRLPTVREVAQWSVRHGASLRESPNKSLAWPLEIDHMQRSGFDAVYLHKGRSQVVLDFYFKTKGFKAPALGKTGKARIWTGDTLVVDSGDAYTFTPGWPTFRAEDGRNIHAVVCVPAQ